MQGKGGFGIYGNTDGNDIPRREAFEWFKSGNGKGMALWYKNNPEAHGALARRQQRGARDLVAVASDRGDDPEPLARAISLGVSSPPRRSASSAPSIISGRSLSKGVIRARAKSITSSPAAGVVDQMLDRREVESGRLHLLDQPQPGDVRGAVVAGARPQLRRRQQAAALVRADVAHRHPGLVGELLDRQLARSVTGLTSSTASKRLLRHRESVTSGYVTSIRGT